MAEDKDVMALKAKSERLENDKAELQSKIEEMEAQLLAAQADGSGDVQVAEVKKKLFNSQRELKERETAFVKKEQEYQERLKKVLAKELATEHGVPVEELLQQSVEDMEKFALKKALELSKVKKPETSKFERGQPSTTMPSPVDMNKDDFLAHVERLKREALARK